MLKSARFQAVSSSSHHNDKVKLDLISVPNGLRRFRPRITHLLDPLDRASFSTNLGQIHLGTGEYLGFVFNSPGRFSCCSPLLQPGTPLWSVSVKRLHRSRERPPRPAALWPATAKRRRHEAHRELPRKVLDSHAGFWPNEPNLSVQKQ
jgi:hypothetical protein